MRRCASWYICLLGVHAGHLFTAHVLCVVVPGVVYMAVTVMDVQDAITAMCSLQR